MRLGGKCLDLYVVTSKDLADSDQLERTPRNWRLDIFEARRRRVKLFRTDVTVLSGIALEDNILSFPAAAREYPRSGESMKPLPRIEA